MKEPTVRIEVDPGEAAAFCMRKLAELEARFIILCHRAEQAGIDCTDLHPPVTEIEPAGREAHAAN